jgi:hypothetical protein
MRFNPHNSRRERTHQSPERIETAHLRGCMSRYPHFEDLFIRISRVKIPLIYQKGSPERISTVHYGGHVAEIQNPMGF